MGRRRLSEDERALWRDVTRSAAPLRKSAPKESEERGPDAGEPAERRGAAAPPPALKAREGGAAAGRPAPTPPPLASLGRRLKKKVARGAHAIDGRLDLHGLTQAQARDALLRFVRTAQARGDKLVLVITGKGGVGAEDLYAERGVLRRQVPHWLRLAEFRKLIVGFETAGPAHGGEGALYVRLRKAHRNPLAC
jgi:DNA-nicking Smr family endonuclease